MIQGRPTHVAAATAVWPRRIALTLIALAIALLVLVRVTVTDPRVHVRWTAGISDAARTALEARYALGDGQPVEGTTWRYALRDSSRDNVRALIADPAVDDTSYLDRNAMTSEGRRVNVAVRYPLSDLLSSPAQLLGLHQSLWLLLSGGGLLWIARATSLARRRTGTLAVLLFVLGVALALPLDPARVTMGGSADHVRSRTDFEAWWGGRVRFEKHLSQVILLRVYEELGPAANAPERAVIAMTRGATLWFVLSALAVGVLEAWSPHAIRYLGLALLAPATMLYFGWRELGYVSLNVATFPLLVRGLAGEGMRLEAGSAVAGLGAALHGSGLVALAGAWLAAAGTPGAPSERALRTLRAVAWGVAAYVGWIALYVILLKLPVAPDPGAAAYSPWRPWSEDEVRLGRVSAAILSPTGARDIAMTAWIVGAPLLAVAASLWRRHPHEVRTALLFAPPSILFVLFRWPFEGVGGGMDLVVAGFPALYGLLWVCARDARRTGIAAALLASAHYAFWRVVLDERFEP
jgi:hypothetical protein